MQDARFKAQLRFLFSAGALVRRMPERWRNAPEVVLGMQTNAVFASE